MTAAYFEDHPTDPDKVIFRKPPLDQGPDYERGFVDGMLYQTQSSVYKAVNRLAQPEQEPVACVEYIPCCTDKTCSKCKAAIKPELVCVCGAVWEGQELIYTTPQRTWVGLDWLPKHKCGLHLSHNEHKDVYESIEEFYDADDFISPEEWHKAVAEDSVWVLHWYPDTPVGFHRVAASTLDAIKESLEK